MTDIFHRYVKTPFMPLFVLAAAFVISLAAFLIFRPPYDGRIFFFPRNSGTSISAEKRPVPRETGKEDAVKTFLDDLFLGPVTFGLADTVPKGSSIRYVILRGRDLYVDFDFVLPVSKDDVPLSFEQVMDNLEYNIRFNFPYLEKIVFTIDGREINAPYFSAE